MKKQKKKQKINKNASKIPFNVQFDEDLPFIIKEDEDDHTVESPSPRNIVVLGSASHLASHISLHLMRLRNIYLHIIDRKDPNYVFIHPEMRSFHGDNRIVTHHWSERDFEREAIKFFSKPENKPDTVINCLAVHDEAYSWNNPIETISTNVVFTTVLMRCLKEINFRGILLHYSSAKVYGYRSKQSMDIKKITEEIECKPVGEKAISRYLQELVVSRLAETYDIKHIIFRLGTLYGYYTPSDNVINTWIRNMLLKTNIRVYGCYGEESRDFTNIFDIADFNLKLVNLNKYPSNVINQVYNLGSTSKNEIRLKSMADAIHSFLRPFSPESKIIQSDYRNEIEEKDYRELLDCTKAQQKIGYFPKMEVDVLKILMTLPLSIAKDELRLDDKEVLELSILCNRPDEMAKQRVLKKEKLNPLTDAARQYLENFTAGVTAKSQKLLKEKVITILNDQNSEKARQLREYMRENDLSVSDLGAVV